MKFTNKTRGVVEFCHGQDKIVCLPDAEVDCPSSLFDELMKYPAVKGYFDLGLFVMTTDEVSVKPEQTEVKSEARPEVQPEQAPAPAPRAQPVPRKRKQPVNS